MSSVRMCDRCGLIFPKDEEGSAELQGTKNRRYSDGNRYTEQVTQDFCPSCVNDMNGTPKVPQVPAITSHTSMEPEGNVTQ
jgi:hypothetical protein